MSGAQTSSREWNRQRLLSLWVAVIIARTLCAAHARSTESEHQPRNCSRVRSDLPQANGTARENFIAPMKRESGASSGNGGWSCSFRQ